MGRRGSLVRQECAKHCVRSPCAFRDRHESQRPWSAGGCALCRAALQPTRGCDSRFVPRGVVHSPGHRAWPASDDGNRRTPARRLSVDQNRGRVRRILRYQRWNACLGLRTLQSVGHCRRKPKAFRPAVGHDRSRGRDVVSRPCARPGTKGPAAAFAVGVRRDFTAPSHDCNGRGGYSRAMHMHAPSKERVLVVEDEADLSGSLAFALRAKGYDVLVADRGASALEALGSFRPDLVLLDLMLPDMSGIEICRHLRNSADRRQPSVIILSARTDEVDRVVGFEVGADDYVPKPFSLRELTLRVEARLRTRTAVLAAGKGLYTEAKAEGSVL